MPYHSHSVKGRWRAAWERLTEDDLSDLAAVLAGIVSAGTSRQDICTETEVTPYELRSVLDGRRLRSHWPGLRLLGWAAGWNNKPLPPDLAAKQQRVRAIAGATPIGIHDADYFFRHLERLDIVTREKCRQICDEISGHYYSYRLSRNPNQIIRSHYHIWPYNPNNRLPHFVNELKYGTGDASADHIERTAQGQIFPMESVYVLLGFVSLGYKTTGGQQYDGLQVNIFPAGQFRTGRKVIEGIFLSYVYTGRYEMGLMRLVRGDTAFEKDQVGEFTFDEIARMCPDVDLSELLISLADRSDTDLAPDGKIAEILLKSCLSFAFRQDRIIPFG